jgi:hypothetical protein
MKNKNIVFINFPSKKYNIEGVYKINNEYVGASIKIQSRISHHYKSAIIKLEKLLENKSQTNEDIINNKTFTAGEKAIVSSIINKTPIVVERIDEVPENEYKYKKRNGYELFYHENPSHRKKCKCGVCLLLNRITSLPYVY